MDRPTIFLSSTVYDFGDLRSALKDYLEARGCRVLASEFTDFTRPLDKHSYEACLDTIEQAELFVLFIGRRVGGWFDEPNKISITRAEYQHAYKLAQQGRIRLLCFVRSDVWDHRQSVRELAKALKADPALSADQRRKLANHPTQAMDDAEAIIAFIDEVTKNGQTMMAAKGVGTAPIANWISPFSTFTQVRQALDPLIVQGLTVREAAGRKALEAQLHVLLRGILPSVGNGPFYPALRVVDMLRALDLRADQLTTKITIDKRTWTSLFGLATLSSAAEADPAQLLPALGSDLLLRYDASAGAFERTEEYDLLTTVIDQAHRFEKSGRPELTEMVLHGKAVDSADNRRVPAALVIGWMHRLLRWVDLIGSARALARSLGGGPLVMPPTMPQTPILDQQSAVAQEAVSLDDVRAFVARWGEDQQDEQGSAPPKPAAAA